VQLVDDMMNDGEEQRFMHHYNFPPFSVNEAMKIRGTGNREIGHGKLAEKALEFMIPDKTVFPYTIRLVSFMRFYEHGFGMRFYAQSDGRGCSNKKTTFRNRNGNVFAY
jgi:hypothetical protein